MTFVEQTMPIARRARLAVLLMIGVMLAGCSASGDTAQGGMTPGNAAPPAQAVVPTAWIDAAARAWPNSEGNKNGVMFVAGPKDCALGDQRVRVSDFEFRWSGAGYGPVDPAADDAFVHRCELSMTGRPTGDGKHGAAGEVELTRYHDLAALRAGIASFRSQTDTPVQDNDIDQVTSGRYTVDTLHRWYPTNPQGLSQAVVVDEQQLAMVSLGVNSLSREDFGAISAQKIADALTDFLERSQAAGPARPAVVPGWAGSVWEDPQERYRIAIAKGWQQDPTAGAADDPGAVMHLVDADRSASVVVVPTPVNPSLPLPAFLTKFRAGLAQAGYVINRDEPMTLDDGRPAHRLDATGRGRRFMAVVAVTDADLFQITCGAPSNRWESKEADLLNMARSFVAET